MSSSVKAITTKLPTYLSLLLQEEGNIKLVYEERRNVASQRPSNDDTVEICDEISELELTGTPLQTDLGEDDTVCFGGDVILERPLSWTAEEAQQYPLALEHARTFINQELRSGKSKKSLFCICNGKDQQHTVGLGTSVTLNKINRTLIYILPCYTENHLVTTMDYMKKDHLKSVRKNAEIQVSTIKNYNLFGQNLQNCPLLISEYNGNISIESKITSQSNENMKMNFQVIVGHKSSSLMSFWKELCRIQSFNKQLENVKGLKETTTLNSEKNLDSDEIVAIITDLITLTTTKRKAQSVLDLKNLRQLNVLENLWEVLKQSRSLSTLRDCFHFFFEEIADRPRGIHIPKEDKSAVAEIVNGILDGRIAVPTLSFSQCLELLIEIGLETLKNDYLVIITNFSPTIKKEFLEKWQELCSENSVTKSATQRRTRISINPKAAITDLTISKLKLTFLDSLHKVAELIFLYTENVPMLEECFDSYCESLCNKFIVKFPKVIQSCDFKQRRLCRFSLDISSADANIFIKEKSPVAFSVKLISVIAFVEVITVFYFSEFPIVPPCIFNDYDISNCEDDDVKTLYVTKLVKYTENC